MSAYSDLMFKEHCTRHDLTREDRARGGKTRAEGCALRRDVCRKLRDRELRPSMLRPLAADQHYRLLTVGRMLRALAGRHYEFELRSLNRGLEYKIRPEAKIYALGPVQWSRIIGRWS